MPTEALYYLKEKKPMKHDPEFNEHEENAENTWKDFWTPKCPVKIGDRFVKIYKADFNLIYWEVTDIQEAHDEDGVFWAVTAKANNISVGQNVKTFSSRFLQNGDYKILKRGVDF